MDAALDKVESFWLKRNLYVGGESVSVGDIVGISEILQATMAGYDPGLNRPLLQKWMLQVKNDLNPHYDQVNKVVYEMRDKYIAENPEKS